ncbi:MAG: ribosomal L7Ae/L30e/S12e/Gadd45 family protein [Clostridia bacterium]|nr:ribosomal L7Ae/L30e/S12e/Gadd45 family protein [Clostridia bacterium]
MNESQIKEMLNNFKYVCGKRQTLRMINESSASIRCIVIAQDAEKQIIQSAIDFCKLKYLSYSIVSTKRKLAEFAGIKVDCSMICFYN